MFRRAFWNILGGILEHSFATLVSILRRNIDRPSAVYLHLKIYTPRILGIHPFSFTSCIKFDLNEFNKPFSLKYLLQIGICYKYPFAVNRSFLHETKLECQQGPFSNVTLPANSQWMQEVFGSHTFSSYFAHL